MRTHHALLHTLLKADRLPMLREGRMSYCRPTEGLEPEYPRITMVPVEEMSLSNGLKRNDEGQNTTSCIW